MMTPELGEMVLLMYPDATAKVVAQHLGLTERSVWHYAMRRALRKGITRPTRPLGFQRTSPDNYVLQKATNEGPRRFLFAHVLAWEKYHRRKRPTGHVIVIVDGDKGNFEPNNLYCLPKGQLLAWMRFVCAPVEVHVDRLWRKVMALDTSEKVKNKLLEQLERLVDPDKPVDIHRQRAVCETVQTLVNLLKVEVDYLRAIEGDGSIPFLETKHTEKARLKKLPRDPLLRGPALDHVWRGSGSRDAS